MQTPKPNPREKRIAYPGCLWVAVPMPAFDRGLLRELNSGEIRRFLAILRVANQQAKQVGEKFQVTLRDLAKIDGASQRTAYRATRRLQARGVIWFTTDTKPSTYILNCPSEWRDRNGRLLDTSKQCEAPSKRN
jgi:hypothetical protein